LRACARGANSRFGHPLAAAMAHLAMARGVFLTDILLIKGLR
jgi:hypothetical protein